MQKTLAVTAAVVVLVALATTASLFTLSAIGGSHQTCGKVNQADLLTPEEGGAFLSLLAAGRSWERPSWQRYFGATPAVMESLREAAREALDELRTRSEFLKILGSYQRAKVVPD